MAALERVVALPEIAPSPRAATLLRTAVLLQATVIEQAPAVAMIIFRNFLRLKIKTAGGQSGILATVRITSILEKLRQHLQENRLSALNLKLPFFTSIQSTNVESSTVHAGKFIALTLPLILTMIIVATCVSFSVDSIDGERSRKTWQLLLVSPLDRNSLLYGKLAATVLSVFLGIATCFTSLLVCSALADASHMDLGITFGIPEALTAAMLSVPLVISLSAFFFLLCMCARNTQEASIFTTAATIVCTLLPFVSTIPSKFIAPALFLIPVVNVALCVSESLETGLVAGHFAMAIFTSCLIRAACIYGCTTFLKTNPCSSTSERPVSFEETTEGSLSAFAQLFSYYFSTSVRFSCLGIPFTAQSSRRYVCLHCQPG